MRLPGLDVIFSLAAPAVDILIEHTGVAGVEIGDDEACVGPVRAGFDAGDDAFDAAPARGPVEELLEAARLAVFGVASKRAFVLASRSPICRRNVVVGATPRM